MGKPFERRGFSSGKVSFAAEFNKVKKHKMYSEYETTYNYNYSPSRSDDIVNNMFGPGRRLKDSKPSSGSFVTS